MGNGMRRCHWAPPVRRRRRALGRNRRPCRQEHCPSKIKGHEWQYWRGVWLIQRLFGYLVYGLCLAQARLARIHAGAIGASRHRIGAGRTAIGRYSQLHEQQAEQRHQRSDDPRTAANLHLNIITCLLISLKRSMLAIMSRLRH